MDIREHLETLANGDGQRIVGSMKKEVDTISTFMKDFSVSPENLKPETRLQWMQMKSHIQASEKLADTLDRHIKRTKELESRRSIRDILRLQDELNTVRSAVEYGKLNRQLKELKTNNSKDLSDLVSNQHQALLKRINLVNRWKSLLSIEIHVLEECKAYVLNFAKQAAESSGDTEFLEEVIQQVKKLQTPGFDFDGSNVNISALQTANVLVLRKTVKHQLDQVVKLEKVIVEKRIALNSLTDIAKKLEKNLPDELKPKPVESIAPASQLDDQADSSRPPPDSSQNRMAFQDKDKR